MSRRWYLTLFATAGVLLLAYLVSYSIFRGLSSAPRLTPAPRLTQAKVTAPPPARPGETPAYLGVVSCTAMACHGAAAAPGTKGAEYTTWANEDPHSRAFAVLHGERSEQMVQSLGLATPAHQTQRCLECHATPAPADQRGPRFALQDGVGCEACHGPAEHWLAPHVTPAWRALPSEQKLALGLAGTDQLTGRLARCATCHVGSPQAQVDHDLIAAGHPRLIFEAGAFHANWPKHWDMAQEIKKDPAREVRLWAVGQAALAEASLRTLAARAADPQAVWPEFAEFDCYACHHQLTDSAWRQKRPIAGRRPGAPVWGTWPLGLLDVLSSAGPAPLPVETSQALDEMTAQMSGAAADRAGIEQSAKSAAEALAHWGRSLEQAEFSPEAMSQLAAALVAEQGVGTGAGGSSAGESSSAASERATWDWESAVQRLLALSALHAAIAGPKGAADDSAGRRRDELFDRVHGLLEFPVQYDSPKNFTPGEVRAELQKLGDTFRQQPSAVP